jgi:ABC-2 type transport system permease protein
VLIINAIGTLPFCAIGLFIGARVSGRTAPAIVNLAYLPMIYLSGLFIPLPASIRFVAVFSPAFHLNQLAQSMVRMGSTFSPTMHAAVLVGVTVLFAGLTVRRLARMG